MRAKIAFTKPGDPGSLVNVAGIGVLKSAGDDAQSATFVEWLLAPETQRWFVTNTYEYPLVPNVPVADGLPPLTSLRGPDVPLAGLDSLPATWQCWRTSDLGENGPGTSGGPAGRPAHPGAVRRRGVSALLSLGPVAVPRRAGR